MLLDFSLLNTEHYKVSIKGKVEQSWEKSNALPCSYWKGSLLVTFNYSRQLIIDEDKLSILFLRFNLCIISYVLQLYGIPLPIIYQWDL